MRTRRTGLVVAGALVALLGFGLLAAGGSLLWLHAFERDDDGFLTTPTETYETTTAALTADLGGGPGGADWTWSGDDLATIRLRVRPSGERAVFVGVADRETLGRWLAGTAHEEVTQIDVGPFGAESHVVPGDRTAPRPETATLWERSVSGSGTQTLVWDVPSGDWSVVVMHADGTAGISVDVGVGAKIDALLPIGVALAIAGAIGLAGGVALLIAGLPDGARPAPAATTSAGRARRPGVYPVRLTAALDEPLSRWQWLVKWVLAIPHAIVLALLWSATAVLTFVAGFTILFTGRYPRAIFDFNVGVMRWTWRVTYYAFSGLGTDRYPPFTLDSDPAYPADFSVDYPEQLSRGLVLVKWWLLAIPHYVIVALLAGGWPFGEDVNAPGLITVLVFVAAVILMFSGSYPRQLFDLVIGFNRWCYRVLAYAALMTDEYPPFRLDSGGEEPAEPDEPGGPTAPALDRTDQLVGG